MAMLRTEVEKLFLAEMAEDDSQFIISEDNTLDDIIPENNEGLFDDTSSNDGLEELIDDDFDDEINNLF